MTHMQNQITVKQSGWRVETDDAGTSFIPCDVVSLPDWLARGVVITSDDALIFDDLVAVVSDYVEGHKICEIEALDSMYFARLSAPGYLDCTEWCAFKTIKEARDYLNDI